MGKNTLRETVYAFNNTDTVATYDIDMDVWHPNRVKMASIVCEVLPFDRKENLRFLELGVGTGYLSHKIIEIFPNATIVAVDAAELMIDKAKVRHGWFVCCDIFKASDAILEARFRRLHYQGIQERTRKLKHQEKPLDQISSELSDKERKDGDHLLFLSDDLQIITESGFRTAECFWKEYREAVYGGIK